MRDSKYQQLKEVIQKAVPEIMALEFGCEVLDKRIRRHKVGIMTLAEKPEKRNNMTILHFVEHQITLELNELEKYDMKILGRPITLSDVLIAIDKNNPNNKYHIRTSGHIGIISPVSPMTHVKAKWNFAKTFDEQDEPLKTFLYDLLVNPQ